MTHDVRARLIHLANRLGDPALDYAILGEGNVSARVDERTFLVTVSGAQLRSAGDASLVEVAFERVLPLLREETSDDDTIRRRLAEAKVDGLPEPRPSVETLMHAVLLGVPGVHVVGHTHPTAINAITCSKAFEQALAGRLFPDEIVLCGPRPLVVPYVDPGIPLAREIHTRLWQFIQTHGEPPRAVYLQNHGFIAMGKSEVQVLQITDMAVKAARILLGTQSLGGPSFLADEAVSRIHHRPDEHYRQRVLDRLGGELSESAVKHHVAEQSGS